MTTNGGNLRRLQRYIYADSMPQIEAKRKAFFRSAVANSLEEVGDKLFIFTHFSKSQWSRLRSHRRVAPSASRIARRSAHRNQMLD
jgi:putative transposase